MDTTQEKILLAALALFFEQGFKKTAVDEVAQRAGVTRITVYRYFPTKEDLVRAALHRSERVFQDALAAQDADPMALLNRIGQEMAALPTGELATRLDELQRVYPDLYADFQAVRMASLQGFFERLCALAKQNDALRPGVNWDVAQAIYWELLVHIFENPRLRELGLSNVEIYRAVSDILLYGLFKGD